MFKKNPNKSKKLQAQFFWASKCHSFQLENHIQKGIKKGAFITLMMPPASSCSRVIPVHLSSSSAHWAVNPVPVGSLGSLLQFSFFFILILFISCSTLPFPNLFASGTLRTATPTVLINLLTNLRFSSRNWNSTRLWRRLWPSSWTPSARLKHTRKEEMQLL